MLKEMLPYAAILRQAPGCSVSGSLGQGRPVRHPRSHWGAAEREAKAAVASLRQAETAYEAALARPERLGVSALQAELRRLQRDTSAALEATRGRLAEIDAAIPGVARAVLKEAQIGGGDLRSPRGQRRREAGV